MPPATFRCNRKRMVLTIKVHLHHVAPSQIECSTSKTRIDLTTSCRRKFRLSRPYPNGMECDDDASVAKLEGHTLILELPITKLGRVPGLHASLPDSALEVGGSASRNRAGKPKAGKRSKSGAVEATAAVGSGKADGGKPAKKAKTADAAAVGAEALKGSAPAAEAKGAQAEAAGKPLKLKRVRAAPVVETEVEAPPPKKGKKGPAMAESAAMTSVAPAKPVVKEGKASSKGKASAKNAAQAPAAKPKTATAGSSVDASLLAALENATATEEASALHIFAYICIYAYIDIHRYIYINTCIYIYICVYMCWRRWRMRRRPRRRAPTHICIYMYICIYRYT